MTTSMPTTPFTAPVPAERLERAAAALTAHGFTVEILDDVAEARTRVKDLIADGASVFTGSSETLRLSGIAEDLNDSGRYDAIKPRVMAMDRATQMNEIRRLTASPDVIVGSVHAVTETGSLVIASGSGSQLPGNAGGAARAIWIVGAQKVVPDLPAALRRVEEHCSRWKPPARRKPTAGTAPSTACSSSTRNTPRDAAPSSCSARPSDSEPAVVGFRTTGMRRRSGQDEADEVTPVRSGQP
ncbi:LUD domain-containing protein [Streptomyces sp. NPDC059063]|uniref:LUD domain-containing protein n=1 Tax=unclassified Streptomyces TaxID=2593676 RepID=UPI003687107D